jgi:hypothetical protein
MFRIIKDQNYQTTAATAEEIPRALRHANPGRYVVEEISPAGRLLPSGHSCRRWGSAIRHDDGHVTLDPDPWRA